MQQVFQLYNVNDHVNTLACSFITPAPSFLLKLNVNYHPTHTYFQAAILFSSSTPFNIRFLCTFIGFQGNRIDAQAIFLDVDSENVNNFEATILGSAQAQLFRTDCKSRPDDRNNKSRTIYYCGTYYCVFCPNGSYKR